MNTETKTNKFWILALIGIASGIVIGFIAGNILFTGESIEGNALRIPSPINQQPVAPIKLPPSVTPGQEAFYTCMDNCYLAGFGCADSCRGCNIYNAYDPQCVSVCTAAFDACQEGCIHTKLTKPGIISRIKFPPLSDPNDIT